MTVGVLAQYMDQNLAIRFESAKWCPRTAEGNRSIVRSFDRFSKATSIDAIDGRELLDYLVEVRKRASPATANKHRNFLQRVLGLAVAAGDRAEIPPLPRFQIVQDPPIAWTTEEIGQLLAAAEASPGQVGSTEAGRWWVALIWLLLNTGLRITAAMTVRQEDLDFRLNRIRVRGASQKNRSGQIYPLLPETLEALGHIRHNDERLFGQWPFDPSPYRWNTLIRHYRKILRRAGVDENRLHLFHCFRRTTATLAVRYRGVNLAQDLLGHTKRATTMRYVEPTDRVSDFCGILASALRGSLRPPLQPEENHVVYGMYTSSSARGG